MAESGSDWPYTLAGALLLLTVVAHCAIKISTWIGDNAYSRQQKRLSRLSSLREAKKSHPDVLLEAEIDAEKAKVNRYDAWCRWRQEKAQKHRNELIENKTSRRRDSFFFTLFSLLLLLILWAIPFLLKCSGLLSPEDGSALSNIKEENLPSVVFLLAFLSCRQSGFLYISLLTVYTGPSEKQITQYRYGGFPGCRHPCCSRR